MRQPEDKKKVKTLVKFCNIKYNKERGMLRISISNEKQLIERTDNVVKKIRSIKWTLLAMSLAPLIVLVIVIGIISTSAMTDGMRSRTLEGLKNTCTALNAGYQAMNDAPYEINSDGHLVKGDFDLSADETIIDSWVEGVDVDVTLFYGDTRMTTSLRDATTNERIVGTKASDVVVSEVLKGGKDYEATDLTINNQNYYAYYMPLTNPDGSIIGMTFAGTPSADVEAFISKRVTLIAVTSIILTAIVCIIVWIIARRITQAIRASQISVDKLSTGDLTDELPASILARKDELGNMAQAITALTGKLKEIIGDIQESSQTVLSSGNDLANIAMRTKENARDIGSAVDGISKGALTQAEEVESATSKVMDMGTLIKKIVDNIENLNETSIAMQKSGNSSSKIMNELIHSNDLTASAIHKISDNIGATDDSVQRIEEAVTLISNIASQTNLLSLNASIEAARAGEAGKGFAVVASEIQKLADESNEATKHITEIIGKLAQDSHNSMEVMTEVNERLREQQDKLTATMNQFNGVSSGISSSRSDTDQINTQAHECNEARSNVENSIGNLASISEEYAASAQQTTASMDELNNSLNSLAESANKLKELANLLEHDTKFFKM